MNLRTGVAISGPRDHVEPVRHAIAPPFAEAPGLTHIALCGAKVWLRGQPFDPSPSGRRCPRCYTRVRRRAGGGE